MAPIALVGEKLAQQAVTSVVLTANATTTAASSAASTAVMTLPAVGYEGGTYRIFISAAAVTKGTTNVSLELWVDGAFNQSIIALSTNASSINPFFWTGIFSVSPGRHTVAVNGFVDAGTGTVVAGTGATGLAPNAIAFVIPA